MAASVKVAYTTLHGWVERGYIPPPSVQIGKRTFFSDGEADVIRRFARRYQTYLALRAELFGGKAGE